MKTQKITVIAWKAPYSELTLSRADLDLIGLGWVRSGPEFEVEVPLFDEDERTRHALAAIDARIHKARADFENEMRSLERERAELIALPEPK